MKERVDALKDEIKRFTASNKDQLEEFRLKFISRKSVVADLFSNMKSVLPEDRKEMGKLLNELKHSAQEKFKELISSLDNRKASSSAPVDLTLPPIPDTLGSLHPLSITRKRILEIFERMDSILYSFGPFVTMSLINMAIIYKFIKAIGEL